MAGGAVITHIASEYQTVTAFISTDRLDALRQLPSVMNVRIAEKPITH